MKDCSRRDFLKLSGEICVLITLNGCASSERVTSLEILKGYNISNGKFKIESLESINNEIFTEEACEVLEDIPIIKGYVMKVGGYAAGVNLWSRLGSFFTGNGFFGRKAILSRTIFEIGEKFDKDIDLYHSLLPDSKESFREAVQIKSEYVKMAYESAIHEQIHHLVDLNFIDRGKFRKAYARLEDEKIESYKKFSEWVENQINGRNFFDKYLFGVGELDERITCVGTGIAVKQLCPNYLKSVYSRVLKSCSKE